MDYCTDRIQRAGGIDYQPNEVRWWEATDEEIAALCGPCRARVDLWRERWRLKTGVGGLKRALLQAYRTWKACL